MTKEQEKAIERIKNISNEPNSIEKVYRGFLEVTQIKQKLYDDRDIKILLDLLQEYEKQISNLMEENLHWRGQYHLLSRKINVIPVKKVKDVLQKNRNELFSTTYVDSIQYKPFEMQVERINKIEKELLED